ncbi:hypothetical protein VTJ83DRAFT_1350 [Remersonia thermophila]|uniref:Uncharacterized protein n=1 Tax=Remersonia thermophila TaxID=72144 RepID=A0ABR4DRU7_9PEZI
MAESFEKHTLIRLAALGLVSPSLLGSNLQICHKPRAPSRPRADRTPSRSPALPLSRRPTSRPSGSSTDQHLFHRPRSPGRPRKAKITRRGSLVSTS